MADSAGGQIGEDQVTQWIATEIDEDCPVRQIVPGNREGPEPGHDSGLGCPCNPCLQTLDCEIESAYQTLLIHHQLVDGKPTRCAEPGAHECSLPAEQRQ